jgi:hypothetical protein
MKILEEQNKSRRNLTYWLNLLENDIHDENGELLTQYKDLGIDENYGILQYILDSILNVNYTCDSNKNYLGAKLTMSYAGPNIYIYTDYNIIVVYWGSRKIDFCYKDKIGLDDYFVKLYESMG